MTYITCSYFVTTVFSTVGFGDIYALNEWERAFYVLLMLCGVMIFGNLLSELAAINQATRELELSTLDRVRAAKEFMEGYNIPHHLSNEVLRWTRFRHQQVSGGYKD